MGLGGRKVIVHGNHVARLDQNLGQEVLSGPPLMHREQVLGSEHVPDGILQFVKAFASGIGVIGHHHGAQLVVAHGVGAAVRQHIQENVPGSKQEGVVARLLHGLQPLIGAWQPCLLNDLDLVHFHWEHFPIGQFDIHKSSFIKVSSLLFVSAYSAQKGQVRSYKQTGSSAVRPKFKRPWALRPWPFLTTAKRHTSAFHRNNNNKNNRCWKFCLCLPELDDSDWSP
ncbi:MAG: hypothetical protein A4E70_01323 [Syntrophus sp. PtaU1.Bin005]|nr:MAG: hypothetical protein A4E70_01323 [Syntrophus sp. PtaU1.Bin005]